MFIITKLEYSTLRYWTGSTWSSIETQAKEFSSRKAARDAMKNVKWTYQITKI